MASFPRDGISIRMAEPVTTAMEHETTLGSLRALLQHSLHIMSTYIDLNDTSLRPQQVKEINYLKLEIQQHLRLGEGHINGLTVTDLLLDAQRNLAHYKMESDRLHAMVHPVPLDAATTDKIAEIKEFRKVSGFGLKESKDYIDMYGTADAGIQALLIEMLKKPGGS